MDTMNRHRQLPVWQDARALVVLAYRITRALPSEERMIVTPQLRRAAWSVLNNLTEGNAKLGRAERRRFLDIAIGSLAETDSMLGVIPDLYPVDPAILHEFEALRMKINHALFHMLRSRPPR